MKYEDFKLRKYFTVIIYVELSILITNAELSAKECINDMLKRWIQENEIKYSISHFGIDKITSYDIISYKELQHLIDDKNIKSGEIKSLENDKKLIEKELGKKLIAENQNSKKNPKRTEKIK